jgi:hypothetical protein
MLYISLKVLFTKSQKLLYRISLSIVQVLYKKNTKRNFSSFLYVNKKILFLLPFSLFFTLKSSLYPNQSPTKEKEKQWKRNVSSFLKFKIKNSFFPFPISYQKDWFRVQAGALQKKIMKGNVKTFLKLKKKR